MTQRCGSGIG